MLRNTLMVLLICSAFMVDVTSRETSWNENRYSQVTVKTFRNQQVFREPIDFDSIDYPLLHAAIFYVTNEQRARHGKSVLAYHPLLEKAAFGHSRDMARVPFFSHYNNTDSSKRTPKQRGSLAGIHNPFMAENIATSFGIQYRAGSSVQPVDSSQGTFRYPGQRSLIPPHTYLSLAESVVTQWMNSPGHRRNILSDKALELGCGVYFYRNRKFYNMPMFTATQNFQLYRKIKTGP